MVRNILFVFLFICSFQTYAYPPSTVKLPLDPEIVLANKYLKKGKEFHHKESYDSAVYYLKEAIKLTDKTDNEEKKVYAYNALGLSLVRKGLYPEALEWYMKGLKKAVRDLGIQHAFVTDIYTNLGVLYFLNRNFPKSFHSYQNALKIITKYYGEENINAAKIYGNMAIAFGASNLHDSALFYCEKSIKIQLKHLGSNHPDIAANYTSMSHTYYVKSDYTKAVETLNKALKIYLSHYGPEHTKVANVYNNLSLIYKSQGYFEEALIYADKALKIRIEKLGESPIIAESYLNTGGIYKNLGDYETALKYYFIALKIHKKAFGETSPAVALNYMDIGVIYKQLMNYKSAMINYQKALDIYPRKSNEGNDDVASIYTNMSNLYELKNEHKRALYYYRKALDIRIKIHGENNLEVARIYQNIGLTYARQEYYSEAMIYIQKALEILTGRLGKSNLSDIAIAYESLGENYKKQHNYKKALACFQKIMAINSKIYGKTHYANAVCYNGIGNIYSDLGEYKTALEWHEKASKSLEINTNNSGPLAKSYENKAIIYDKLNDSKSALNYYQQAINSFSKTLNNLDTYSNPPLKDIYSGQEMLRLLCGKIRITEKLYIRENDTKALRVSFETSCLAADLLDLVRNDIGNEELKYEIIKENLAVIYETSVRTAFKLYKLTGKEEYPLKAFNAAERSKAYLLLQSLKDTEAKQFSAIPDSLLEKEKNLKIEIAFYEKQLIDAEQRKDSAKTAMYQNYLFEKKNNFEKLIKQLESEFPDYYQLKYDSRIASVKEIQEKLIDNRSAFIEYFWGDSTVYSFVVTKNNLHVNEIKNPKILRQKINTLQQLVHSSPRAERADQNRKQMITLSRELHSHLVPSLDSDINRLIIIPDGPLNFLPFDILLTKKTTADEPFSKLPYLIKKYNLSYGYSATTLLQNQLKKRKPNNNLCLAFAPVYENTVYAETLTRGSLDTLRGENYAGLPGAQREVRAVAQQLSGKYFFGKHATEERFKHEAADYAVLHLAMHGKVDNEHSMNSKLVFTPTDSATEDGFLYAYELYNLNLNAELAVLSACQTGAGQLVRGEGVMSLARGFMYAGVQSVLLTLWNADDKSSAAITEKLYEVLQNGKSKDEALREAKLHYLQTSNDRLAHPFYWAGFTAFGDMKPLKQQNNNLFLPLIAGVILLTAGGFIAQKRRKRRKRQ